MMHAQTLLLIFFILCGIGMLLSLVAKRAWLSTIITWAGSLAAICLVLAAADVLTTGQTFALPLWSLPGLTTLSISLDALSGVFLGITGLVLFPASIYAGGQIEDKSSPPQARLIVVLLLGLYASIALILIAGEVLLFLLAWEIMSIISYLLIAQDQSRETGQTEASYRMLAMGELGTLAVAFSFLLLAVNAHSMQFAAIKSSAMTLSTGMHWSIFLLSFFGFGVKAGLVPLNFWLPNAYALAPRFFVPILAGATLNLGIYGILKVNIDVMPAVQVETGALALVIGTLSALLGILYATTENDLKKMLAHSSIENGGIVIAAMGAGMVFAAAHHPMLAAMAFVTSLYHLINHALYKTLLYFGVGIVEWQAGTRDMDRLGGLIKWLPLTSACFLIGTLSIAALPPFNGFVSEWLTLQIMLRSAELASTPIKIVFALCGAGLALTAALAVTCFVKVFAMTFLGLHRGTPKAIAQAPAGARRAQIFLAVLCLAFGVLPTYIIPVLSSAITPLIGASASEGLVPAFFAATPSQANLPAAFVSEFHDLGAQIGQDILPGRGLVVLHRGETANPVVFAMSTSYMLIMLSVLLAVTYAIVRLWLTRQRQLRRGEPWAGGLPRLLPEMTYTATGFSNSVRVIFEAIFRPTTVEDTKEAVMEHFRTAIIREKEHVHLLDKWVWLPISSALWWIARLLAAMHHGRFNAYAAYTFLAILSVLLIYLWLS